MIYVTLSLVYGALRLLSTAHTPVSNHFLFKDALALLVVAYSAKHRGRARVGGVPSLLDKIFQDATTYFLVLSTGHLLLVLCEIFAPVSDPVNLYSPLTTGYT